MELHEVGMRAGFRLEVGGEVAGDFHALHVRELEGIGPDAREAVVQDLEVLAAAALETVLQVREGVVLDHHVVRALHPDPQHLGERAGLAREGRVDDLDVRAVVQAQGEAVGLSGGLLGVEGEAVEGDAGRVLELEILEHGLVGGIGRGEGEGALAANAGILQRAILARREEDGRLALVARERSRQF